MRSDVLSAAALAGGATKEDKAAWAAASNVEPEQMLAVALQAAQQFEVIQCDPWNFGAPFETGRLSWLSSWKGCMPASLVSFELSPSDDVCFVRMACQLPLQSQQHLWHFVDSAQGLLKTRCLIGSSWC